MFSVEQRFFNGSIDTCALLTRALEYHISNSLITQYLARAITSVSNNNLENQIKLSESGMCEVLARALENYTLNASVTEELTIAMIHVSQLSLDNKIKFCEVGIFVLLKIKP